jgi:exodeoxyribonuclease VII small subunit
MLGFASPSFPLSPSVQMKPVSALSRHFRQAAAPFILENMPPSISPQPDGSGPCPPTFEQALEQLERIVHQLEEGDIGLAEALDHYETGIGLLKQCYGLLQRAERRIELLSGVDAAGNPITEPFADDGERPLAEKSQNRAKQRTRTGGKTQGETAFAGQEQSLQESESAKSPQIRIDEPGSLF